MKKQVLLKIRGKVQGVWYRASAKKRADELGICGWVKNDPDGGVSILSESEEDILKEFIEWCRMGPPLSKVTEISEDWKEFSGNYSDFKILY